MSVRRDYYESFERSGFGSKLRRKINRYRVFGTKQMVHIPKWRTDFRVGPTVGMCILRTRWFVVMDRKRLSFREGTITRVDR